MKALAIERVDGSPVVLDVPDPSAGDGEVLVRIGAASVNGFDLAIAAGRVWESMPHEFVSSLGADDVVDFRGDVAAAVRAVAPDGVSAILHAAGDATVLAGLLTPGGRMVSLLGATAEQVGRDDVTVIPIQSKYTPE